MTLRTTRCTTCNRRVYVSAQDAFSCPVCSSPLSRSPSSLEAAPASMERASSLARRHHERLDEEMRLLGPRGLEQEKRIHWDVLSHPGAVGAPLVMLLIDTLQRSGQGSRQRPPARTSPS